MRLLKLTTNYLFAALKFCFALLCTIGLATACSHLPKQMNEPTEIANPAAVFCIELGGQYQIIQTEQGQVGRCYYLGKNYDAWQLFSMKATQNK